MEERMDFTKEEQGAIARISEAAWDYTRDGDSKRLADYIAPFIVAEIRRERYACQTIAFTADGHRPTSQAIAYAIGRRSADD